TRRRLQRQRHFVGLQDKSLDVHPTVDHLEVPRLQRGANARVVLAVFGPEDLRIGLGALADRFAQLLRVLDTFYVQLVADPRRRPVGKVAEGRAARDARRWQRLLPTDGGALAGGVAQAGDQPRQVHRPLESRVA